MSLVVLAGEGRVITAEYSGGMYVDLGFAHRYPIEVLDVSPHARLRKNWELMTKAQKQKALGGRVLAWVKYMDDPNDDGHWAGWFQDYVDASRPRE